MTVKQVGADLAISYRAALELIETRAIRAIDVRTPGAARSAWRVEREDLEAFKRWRATREKDGAERAERGTSRTIPQVSEV